MKKLLIAGIILFGASKLQAAFDPVRYVQISTKPVTQQTGSFNVQGGTMSVSQIGDLSSTKTITMVFGSTTTDNGLFTMPATSTFTVASSSITMGNAVSTTTHRGLQNIAGEVRFNGVTSSTGMIPVSQGSTTAPVFQWDGRINGPDSYSITTTTSTAGTAALGAATSLTGTHTTLSVGEKVTISVSGTCQIAASDGGSLGLKRDSTNVSGASAGAFRINNNAAASLQTSCGFNVVDTPGSIGTFTYTVTFNSTSGGTFQFGETNRASWMIITGYPK